MAPPDLRLRTPTGTGANRTTKSANGSRANRRGKTKTFPKKESPEAPPAGRRRPLRTRSRKKDVDTGWPSHGSLEYAPRRSTHTAGSGSIVAKCNREPPGKAAAAAGGRLRRKGAE